MLESAGFGCKFLNTYCLFKMACIYYSDKYLNINYFIFHISEKVSYSVLLASPLNFRDVILEASDCIPKAKYGRLYSFPKNYNYTIFKDSAEVPFH